VKNNLIIDEAFLQLNINNGYKYWDITSEIIDSYVNMKSDIHYTRNPNDLLFKNFDNRILEVRHAIDQLWMKMKLTNINQILDIVDKPLDIITNLQKVKNLNRIGVRFRFVYPKMKQSEIDRVFNKLNNIRGTSLKHLVVNHQRADIRSIIRIERVTSKNDNSDMGILFDVDAFFSKEIEIKSSVSRIKILLDYIESDIDNIIEEIL